MWTFYVIAFIVALFVAYLIARAIGGVIKRRRSDKRWAQWKQEQRGWNHV